MPGIPRICPCGYRVPAGAACACQKAKRAEADKARPGARKRGYTTEWQKAAAAFLKEPGHDRCACGARATVVMHRISIRQRPDLKMTRSNWASGCVRCNAIQADRERRQPRSVPEQGSSVASDRLPGSGRQLHAKATGPVPGLFSAKISNRTANSEVLE